MYKNSVRRAFAGLLAASTSVALAAPAHAAEPDVTAPVVTSTGLTDGQWLGLWNDVIPAWTDEVGVTKVEVLVNGAVTRTYEGTLPREVEVYPPYQLHNQEARVTIRAYDAAGNKGERTTPVRVDVLSPDATVTPAPGTALRGVVTFRAADVSPDTERLEFMDSTGTVVARSTAAPWTMTWDTRTVANGPHYLQLRRFDWADNVSFGGGEFRVDNAGPAVTSITPANKALVRGTVRTTIKATDPSGVASARVTGGKATSTPLTWTATPKAQGPYTIVWTLTDKLGNTTVARRVVVNDTVAPALKFAKAPKNNAKLTKTTTITATASDTNGVAKVQLLVNGKVAATDAKAGWSFSLNPKKYGTKFTVQLRAYDKAGNSTTIAKRTYRR